MADTNESTEHAASPSGLIPRVIAWALQRRLVRAFLLYSEHRGAMLADSITYRALFSVFAAVLLGFSIASLWLAGNPQAWQALVDAVDNAIPGLVGGSEGGGVIDLSNFTAPTGIEIAGIVSFFALVGAAISAIGSLRTALRVLADKVSDDLFFLWVILRNLGLGIVFALLLGLSAFATFLGVASVSTVTDWLGLPERSPLASLATTAVGVLVVFALDTAVIVLMFRVLSGVRAPARVLWGGALLGGAGLTVLQQLSGLFVGGASSNPLLVTFGSLIALLIWFNLSAQVILIAASCIIVGTEEHEDRVRARFGAATFAQRRVRRAENAVQVAVRELEDARAAEEKERAGKAGADQRA